MKRKVLGFVAALVLTVAGTAILVAYVRGAEDRALAGEEVAEIYVVDERIGKGESVDDIADKVRVEQVQAKVRVNGAIGDLDDLEGLVASVDLLPGEQLTRSRFVVPAQLESDIRSRIEVPEGMMAVTVRMSPERAFGGGLIPGQDEVAILASFEPFAVALPEAPDGTENAIELDGSLFNGSQSPNTTATILRHVPVLDVVPVEAAEQDEDEDGAVVVEAPPDDLLVTLALDLPAIERVVFVAEFGARGRENPLGGLWLALDGPEVDEQAGSQIWTRANIYNPEASALPDLQTVDGNNTVSDPQ